MKKIIISIVIFLCISGATSYAQLFENQDTNNNETSTLDVNSSNNQELSNDDPGLFRDGGDGSSELLTRPDNGNGIGQTPIGDGLHILLMLCLLWGIFKSSNTKKRWK